MKTCFHFRLPGASPVVEISSDRDWMLSRVMTLYRKYLVCAGDCREPDAAISVRSRKGAYWVLTPWESCIALPDENEAGVSWRWAARGQGVHDDNQAIWATPSRQRPLGLRWESGLSRGFTRLWVQSLVEISLFRSLQRLDQTLEVFHAAAATRHGRCIVLVGDSHSGKTTTCITLCSRGWRFICDDILLADMRSGQVRPFSRRVVVRPSSAGFSLLPYLDGQGTAGQPGKRSWGDFSVKSEYCAVDRPYPITDVLFLGGFSPSTQVAKLSAIDGMMWLSKWSFNPIGSSHDRLGRYLRCFGHVRFWNCVLGSEVSAAETIAKASVAPLHPGSAGRPQRGGNSTN